jgi:hypothetical protein
LLANKCFIEYANDCGIAIAETEFDENCHLFNKPGRCVAALNISLLL